MRRLIFQMLTSLDGYFEGPHADISWHRVDEEFNAYAAGLLSNVSALLFGRVTYELMASYWPTAENNDPVITRFMNDLPKYVVSSTLTSASWGETQIINRDAAREVADLKELPGKDMAIFGSSELAASLAAERLIDEFRIMVSPTILGAGKTLMNGFDQKLELKLKSARTFKSGIVVMCCEPVTSAGPQA